MTEAAPGENSDGEDKTPKADDAASFQSFAAAIVAQITRTDPGVASDMSTFLQWQSRLLETQDLQLRKEHDLRMTHLRDRERESWLRRMDIRVRMAIQVVIATGVVVGAIGFLWMFREEMGTHGLVIDLFDTPPDLE